MAVNTLPSLKPVRMYRVTFNEYYHMLCEEKGYTRVQYKPEKCIAGDDPILLIIPDEFIIREDEFYKYYDYGRGFHKMEYVGSMLVEEPEEETEEVVAK